MSGGAAAAENEARPRPGTGSSGARTVTLVGASLEAAPLWRSGEGLGFLGNLIESETCYQDIPCVVPQSNKYVRNPENEWDGVNGTR